jgi:polyisoprenoid-binding protein YceI
MKKITTLLFLSIASMAFGQTWTQDKNHSQLGFTVTHLMISEVQGSFKKFDVKITATKDDLSDAVFEVTADVNSISTDVEGRDNDLRSDKFFDVAKFPTLTFKSTSFKKIEGSKYELIGDLTLKGVTKSVALNATLNGPVPHPFNKKPMAALKITGVIKRTDFGVGAIPAMVASEDITITANGEIVKQ